MVPRKRRRKPIRFRQISFKFTEGQKAALERYCRAHNLTPIRFIKSLVLDRVERFRPEALPPSYVTPNQLDLFEKGE
jgi:hypothetical protein